jgi:hypothetical protein
MATLAEFCKLLVIVASAFFLKAGAEGARAAASPTCGTWNVTFSPNPGMTFNSFNGVATLAANDAWAVGFYQLNSTSADQTLIEHWNGSQWNIVASPSTGQNSVLYGVAASSATNAWAVGHSTDSTGITTALIEHWNGSQWSIIASHNVSGSTEDTLFAVSALSTNNVWAVGYYRDGITGLNQTLTEQWNGSHWSIVPSANKGAHNNELLGVSAISRTATSVWAVGDYNLGKSFSPPYHTLAEFHC